MEGKGMSESSEEGRAVLARKEAELMMGADLVRGEAGRCGW